VREIGGDGSRTMSQYTPLKGNRARQASPPMLIPMVTGCVLLVLLSGVLLGVAARLSTASPPMATPTPTPPSASSRKTPLDPAFAAFATQHDAVDPAFQTYYATHTGPSQLGTPITPGFLTSQGWVQFFTHGALLLPEQGVASGPVSAKPGDLALQLLDTDEPSKTTGGHPSPAVACAAHCRQRGACWR